MTTKGLRNTVIIKYLYLTNIAVERLHVIHTVIRVINDL